MCLTQIYNNGLQFTRPKLGYSSTLLRPKLKCENSLSETIHSHTVHKLPGTTKSSRALHVIAHPFARFSGQLGRRLCLEIVKVCSLTQIQEFECSWFSASLIVTLTICRFQSMYVIYSLSIIKNLH